MKASIEKYERKFLIETPSDDEDVFEFTRNIYNLMCCLGYSRINIIEGLKQIIEDEQAAD